MICVRQLFQAAWLALLVFVLASAADAATPVAVNDSVEIQWVGQWRAAKVTKVNPRSGWVTVALRFNNQNLTPTLPPEKVRPKPAIQAGNQPVETPPAPKQEHQYESKEFRDWTDVNGKALPRARVHDGRPGARKILLQKPDGVCYAVELSQLSAKDRAYIDKLIESVKPPK